MYAKLALWSDKNGNGIAERGELEFLRDAGLVEIDLAYDPNFREEDRYGNVTELKSTVRFEDGRTRLIFDLWFRYLVTVAVFNLILRVIKAGEPTAPTKERGTEPAADAPGSKPPDWREYPASPRRGRETPSRPARCEPKCEGDA
ncbi:MAG: hypothetical protein HC902_03565, partial [Calothrix sp. SM1_5_4]|nr:hypothetical protein [Calothrix sp. SM1_5_4]